jgi:hypothetical protein
MTGKMAELKKPAAIALTMARPRSEEAKKIP